MCRRGVVAIGVSLNRCRNACEKRVLLVKLVLRVVPASEVLPVTVRTVIISCIYRWQVCRSALAVLEKWVCKACIGIFNLWVRAETVGVLLLLGISSVTVLTVSVLAATVGSWISALVSWPVVSSKLSFTDVLVTCLRVVALLWAGATVVGPATVVKCGLWWTAFGLN